MKRPKDIALQNDYNGKVQHFIEKFPRQAEALLKSEHADDLMNGLNSFRVLTAKDGTQFIFLETPGHGYYLNMDGQDVGEEDDGFRAEYSKYNAERKEMHAGRGN